jgi:rhodanese-related sulfurtransferase
MMSDQPRVPGNFKRMAALNRAGVPLLPAPFPAIEYSADAVAGAIASPDHLVLDARSPETYSTGHIPGSIYLGLDSGLPTWLGWLFPPDRKIIAIVDDAEQAKAFFVWLARVGYDNMVGYLPEGVSKWRASGRDVRSLALVHPSDEILGSVIDVRTPREYAAGSVPHAASIPLCELPGRLAEIPADQHVTLMCEGGYRGTIAASLLLNAGFRDVANAEGGYSERRTSS